MYQVVVCPKHHKRLIVYKETNTHTLFKCPICDYIHYPGVVHLDLPEKYRQLQAENNRLKEALQLTIDRWRLIGRKVWDTKLKVSILELERQLEKDVEQILKG